MEQIKVYTKKRCPYCTSAKIWLTQKDYQFEEISLDDAEILREFTADICRQRKHRRVL
jgi:glutaredoxin